MDWTARRLGDVGYTKASGTLSRRKIKRWHVISSLFAKHADILSSQSNLKIIKFFFWQAGLWMGGPGYWGKFSCLN